MILTIDIGNSRIKWAQWLTEVIIARGAASYDAHGQADDIGRLLATVEKPDKVLAVCVANDRLRELLAQWVRQNWQLDVVFLETQRTFGHMVNAYDDPKRHGADRWASVVAAHHLFPDAPVCVINAGSATAIDYVDQQGRHLGGYIMPSFSLMYDALTRGTAKLGLPDYNELSVSEKSVKTTTDEIADSRQDMDATPFPRDTLPAVTEGLHRFIRSGVRDICRQASEKLGCSSKVVLTGGFAKTILAYTDMPEMVHKPDLVMHGVYIMLKDTPGQIT
jgi:type III pantothenate kinase